MGLVCLALIFSGGGGGAKKSEVQFLSLGVTAKKKGAGPADGVGR
jgi:hypothetical protein